MRRKKGYETFHERPDGYSISVSKVVPFPINILFNIWNDDNRLDRWLVKDNFTVRSRHLNKNIHITWIDGKTNVNFFDKGTNKSQVVVQHNKLSSLGESEKVKLYWKGKLDLLAKLNIS